MASSYSDEYEKISYRQVGKLPGGKIAKGVIDRTKGPAGQKTDKKYKSSIPSKFETVLHKGPREADGFGSQNIRFKAHGNENPGVGKYHNPRSSSMLWNPEENKGTSNFKGYGGLVSKTNRFSKRTELEASQEPGPGSHNSVGVWASRRDFNAAGVTANYAKPRRYRDDPPIDLKMVPGPGMYPTQNMNRAINTKRSVGRSSFRSTSSRLRKENLDVMSQPAPGDYDVRMATKKLNSYGSLPGQSAWGKDRAPRGMDAILKLGAQGPGPGAYSSITKKEIQARTDPLPTGGIRVLDFTERRKLARANKNGKSFGGTGHDRFGKPYMKKTIDDDPPGPGSYYRMTERGRALVSSSWGLSKSKRGIEAQLGGTRRPPGPAFYKPAKAMKKSFMLNAGRRWV